LTCFAIGEVIMKVLVTYGTKLGGTRGIAETIAATLQQRGLDADVIAADDKPAVRGYDAVVVGGALYATRWRRSARRFVRRNAASLNTMPVWFFSSGPLDDSATTREIPPVKSVQRLMERVAARGHATFGGRLPADAKGFPASAMAKKNAGDWRDQDQIRRFANSIADALQASRAPA
jgi:menaquinone-dependent protoporphyrinogen oxidase